MLFRWVLFCLNLFDYYFYRMLDSHRVSSMFCTATLLFRYTKESESSALPVLSVARLPGSCVPEPGLPMLGFFPQNWGFERDSEDLGYYF